jgi:conjugative transfer signal peptidase TraF
MRFTWKERFRRCCVSIGILMVAAFLYGIDWHYPILPPELRLIFFNETSSLPRGVYLRIPAWYLHDGDFVVFTPNEETSMLATSRSWSRPNEYFLKKIGAIEGEDYQIDAATKSFFANRRYIGQVIPKDRNDEPMPIHAGDFIVPKGEFLPIGTNPRSFDGRYTGTVSVKNIHAKVIPFITEMH